MTVSSCENLAPVFMVSIGIVALNEEVALPTLLEDVLKQDFPRNRMELLLADSGSTDSTARYHGSLRRRAWRRIRGREGA